MDPALPSIECGVEFSVTTTTLPGEVLVLRLVGEIDAATVGELRDALRIATARSDRVVADLSRVSFISCAGLTALHDVHDSVPDFTVVARSPLVLRALRVTALDRKLDVQTEIPERLLSDQR